MRFSLNGAVASDEDVDCYRWWGLQAVAPKDIRDALEKNPSGEPFILEINSGGGDVIAGFEMYSLLRGAAVPVRAEVQSLAASAASVVLMGADTAAASPVAQVMIHLPSTAALGNQLELQKSVQMLDSITESILNAYEKKSRGKITREELRKMMDNETFLSAQRALEIGLLDEIIDETDEKKEMNTARFTIMNAFGGLPDIAKLRALYEKDRNEKPEKEPLEEPPEKQLAAQKRRRLLALAEADCNYIKNFLEVSQYERKAKTP